MNRQQKIETAQAFVRAHKDSNIDNWQPLSVHGDHKWLAVYDNIVNGVYGECTTDEECDEEGNVIVEASSFEIEIDSHDHFEGRSVIFSF